MSRDQVYRFRLTAEDAKRLEQEAKERGLRSKADRIREALGWDRNSVPDLPASEQTKAMLRPPTGPKADPDAEPGKSAIEELAKKIYGSEGKTMAAAKREAEKRLKEPA